MHTKITTIYYQHLGTVLFHSLGDGCIHIHLKKKSQVVHLRIYILLSIYGTLIKIITKKDRDLLLQRNVMCGPCLDLVSYKPTV